MTNPKRYTVHGEHAPTIEYEEVNGEWVKWEDCEVLRTNLTAAEEGLANYALEVERVQMQLRVVIAQRDEYKDDYLRIHKQLVDLKYPGTVPAHEPLPVAEPEAWLIHCWKPGTHCVFATVDEEDASWWPTDQWKGVTRVPLVSQGQPTLLHGELPPSEAIAVKSSACAYIGAPEGKPEPCVRAAGHPGLHKHAQRTFE